MVQRFARRNGLPRVQTRHTQHEIAQREAGTQFDRALGGTDRLVELMRKDARDGQSVVRVRALLFQFDRLHGRVQAFAQVGCRVEAPAIRGQPRAYAGKPDITLRQIRGERACFPKKLACAHVVRTCELVKQEGALAHQVPHLDVAIMTKVGGKRGRSH